MFKGIGKQDNRRMVFALVLCLLCGCCAGCGGSQVTGSKDSSQASERMDSSSEGDGAGAASDVNAGSESAEDLPGYLAACTAVDGTENLMELRADFLTEGNYDTVLLFGENLLFVRMYIDEDALTEDGMGEYEYDENFCYSFAVYSLGENAVLATCDTKDDPIDYYQVVGDRLFLVDYVDYEIRIYDGELSLAGVFDASSFLEDSDGTFYASADENAYYFMSYADYSLKLVSFADGTAVVQDCDTGFYCSYIAGVSASGSKLVLQTVNAETFFNELLVVNAADLSVEKTYARISAYFPTLSDSAFLTGTDYENGLYLCEKFAGSSKYFTLADTLTVQMLGDYIVTVQDALYESYDDSYSDAGNAGSDVDTDSSDRADGSDDDTDNSDIGADSDDGISNTSYTLCAYNGNGTYVSGFSYLTDGNIFSVSEPVYLKQQDCCVVLMKDYGDYGTDETNEINETNETNEINETDETDGADEADEVDTFLLIWDMTQKGEIPDETRGDVPEYLMMCESEEVALAVKNSASAGDGEGSEAETGSEDDSDGYIYGDTVTLVTDPDSYDWGDLADVRAKADALAEQYDIEIYLGPEIPTYISDYQTEQCLDAEVVSAALDQLEEILALYPESLYPQLLYGDLQGIRTYLTGSIWGQGDYLVSQATAFVDEINDYAVLVADAWQYGDWNYTVNHEISHLIDRSLAFRSNYRSDSLYSEETWSACNPENFEYAGTYEDFSSLPWYDYMEYFLDEYGMTFATEDRAQLFGAAVSNYMDSDTYFWVFTEDSPLVQKLVYYCECIRDDFDSEGWDEVLPWEEVVEEYIT